MQPKQLEGFDYNPLQIDRRVQAKDAWKPYIFEKALKEQQRKSEQPSGGGNFLTSLIPTATSLAALGLAPFTGGGSLGLMALGAGGGLIGKGIQNAVEDKPIFSNPMGYASEGAFGAIPGVLKGAKVLRHAPKGAKFAALAGKTDDVARIAGGLADDAVKAGGTIYDDAGRVATGARRSDMAASGFKYGQATGGGQYLNPNEAKKAYQFARQGSKKYLASGVRAGTPMAQADDAAKVFNKVTKQLTDKLDDVNRVLTKTEKSQISKAVKAAVANDAAITGKTTAQANKLLKLLDKTDDLKGLEKLRQQADKVGWNLSSAGKTAKAAEARAFRSSVDDWITNTVDLDDSYKALKTDWSQSKSVMELTSKAKSAGTGMKLPFGQQLPNTGLKSKTMSKIANRGKDLSFVGGAAPGFMAAPSFKRQAMQMGVGKGLLGGFSAGGGAPTDDPMGLGLTTEQIIQAAQEAGVDPATVLGDVGGQQDPMAQQAGGFQQQQPQQIIPHEAVVQAMMADLQTTGGKNLDKLQKFYEFANMNATGGGQYGELSSTQQKEMGKIDSVEASLQQLTQMLDAAGGGQGIMGALTRNIGTKIPGVASDARVFEGFRSALIAPLARAISGEVGVLTDRDIKRAEGLLPKLSDTPEEAQKRIDSLQALINSRRQNITGSPGAELSVDEYLMQQADPSLLGGFAQ